jgi:hypothetical protein
MPTELQLAAFQSSALTWLLHLATEAGHTTEIPETLQTGLRELCAVTDDRLMLAVSNSTPHQP